MQQLIKRLLSQKVRAVFNDQARGKRPVKRREDGLFGLRSSGLSRPLVTTGTQTLARTPRWVFE